MVLSRGCTWLRSALPLARARSAPTQQNLHSPTEFRTHSCWDILPQISEHTEHSCWIFSHRFHFLMRDSPTDFTHRSYGAFKGVHLFQVHQHNKIYILPQNSEHILAGIFSHRFHRFTQKFLLRKLPQISQNTQNFLAEIFSHRFHRFTQNFLAGKNSVKSVDSVGDIHALTSMRICEICGSFSTANLEQYRKDQSMRK